MNQVKIGKFIAQRRKEKNLTQAQLAEKLNITDRAVSKWETGKGMPDSSIMLDLCSVLDVSVNELLSGEMIEMKEYNNKSEELLLKMTQEKEKRDKEFLNMEIFIGILVSIILISCVFVASFVNMPDYLRIGLIIIGLIPFIIGVGYAIRIEQVAGYYECQKCHYKYVPNYKDVLFAMHIGRKRKMKCPKCGSINYHKKVIN
ncbi:helix-turn-helix domain-containing protein [Massilimicrobiota timonensis]|uniref:helix-turn-helix domain-containing protein n=1 Tax=Massilimicrobiota timonensis TaxID=1776392 RepID=UPI00195F4F8F|nr:helix-turn-helix domain-containing protein [Massilimicrobiota timonensis]MBM6965439.1 helix-turn-helix domain-containing protein [Massilimicrobiota timonensis]